MQEQFLSWKIFFQKVSLQLGEFHLGKRRLSSTSSGQYCPGPREGNLPPSGFQH